jgi:hypothetical protein
MDSKAKNALTGCVVSIGAVLDCLGRKGVAKAAIQELRSACDEGRHIYVLERCQEYVEACCQDESVTLLLISAWTTVCRHTELQYKRAYKYYHSLRQAGCAQQEVQSWRRMYHWPTELKKALAAQVELAELCCASRKGLILAQARHGKCSVRIQ